MIALAKSTKSVVAVLNPVPHQPLTFYDHPLGHDNITGYDIAAYSWWKFINDSSAPPEWLVQFPMVKATVRAMDTILNFTIENTDKKDITTFVLAGAAMNGWTAWLTAAVDKRVTSIIPFAMDVLNITESFRHQFRAYCGWSYGMKPFYDMNITQNLDDPRFALLASHVDPMEYNERYTNVTKFIMIITGDSIFLPDNSHYYFPQLKGTTYFYVFPNVDYRMQLNRTLLIPVISFYFYISRLSAYRGLSWKVSMTNTTAIINIYTRGEPNSVYCYQADTADGTRRDFRMKVAPGDSTKDNPVTWTRSDADKLNKDAFKKEVEIPAEGWRGFFIQALYDVETSGLRTTLTSNIYVIPDTFPCPDCNGDECRGTLV